MSIEEVVIRTRKCACGLYEALSRAIGIFLLKPWQVYPPVFYVNIEYTHIQVLVYVNDVPIIAEDDNDVNGVMRTLISQFTLKYLARASELVGVSIEYEDHWWSTIRNQAGAIRRCRHKYGMEQCKPISTLMEMDASALLREEAETI